MMRDCNRVPSVPLAWKKAALCGNIKNRNGERSYAAGEHWMSEQGLSTNMLVSIPAEFFTRVLPAITLASEMKVTLHIFYRLSRQQGQPRRIRWEDLANDRVLRDGLRAISPLRPPEELLDEGLDAAVRRGTLLHLVSPGAGRVVNWYLVNTAANRAWARRIVQQGELVQEPPRELAPEQRSAVLDLYEQNIGIITPIVLEELRAAEERYPTEWISQAIREAVQANARSWRYVKKILERWAANGKRSDAPNYLGGRRPIDIEHYTSGAFGDLFRRGSDVSDLT